MVKERKMNHHTPMKTNDII